MRPKPPASEVLVDPDNRFWMRFADRWYEFAATSHVMTHEEGDKEHELVPRGDLIWRDD